MANLLAMAVLAPAGCQSPAPAPDAQVAPPETVETMASPSAQQIDPDQLDDPTFLAYLAERSLVTVDDAFRAAVILAEGEDTLGTFEARQEYLVGKDIVRPAWGLQSGQNIDKGSVAFMVARILQLKGGLNRVIFGSWGLGDRRYAYRELVYRRIIRMPGVDYQPMPGGEMVALLGVADEWMSDEGIYEQEPVTLTIPE